MEIAGGNGLHKEIEKGRWNGWNAHLIMKSSAYCPLAKKDKDIRANKSISRCKNENTYLSHQKRQEYDWMRWQLIRKE